MVKKRIKKQSKKENTLDLGDFLISTCKQLIDGIGSFIHERQDIINKLEDHGIEITEDKIRLLRKRRKYTESDQIVLKQLTEEIIANRQKKLQSYRKQIAETMEVIKKTKIKINKDASKELESEQKAFKAAMKIQYGFWDRRKIIKEKNAAKNYEEEINKKIEYYMRISNIPLLEQMCFEIPIQYRLETQAFIDVMMYIKKIKKKDADTFIITEQQRLIESYTNPDFRLTTAST
jgi:hypothetical protein